MNIYNLIMKKIEKQDLETELASLNTIGERLYFLRKKYLKISRAKLSLQIGIEANMLNKYENGYFEPKADRIKQFADFYEIPIEYLTGDNSKILLKEDYFLISNLHMFCWEVDRGFAHINNRNEIEIALYKTNKIVVKAVGRLNTGRNELKYIANIFSRNKDASIFETLNVDTLIQFFDKKISDLQLDPTLHTHQLDYLSRIMDFGICTIDALTKKEYLEVIKCLKPLIAAYQEHTSNTEETSSN